MATIERNAHVDWEGTVKEGKGEVKAGTGAFSLPITFPARVEKPGGKTSPEELIAKARRLHVSATVGADFGEAGLKIQSSHLQVIAEGLEGINAAQFSDIAKE